MPKKDSTDKFLKKILLVGDDNVRQNFSRFIYQNYQYPFNPQPQLVDLTTADLANVKV